MILAAVYARKSTEQSGITDEQKSITRQFERGEAFAVEMGCVVEKEFCFSDDGVSGAEFEHRPGLVRLLRTLGDRRRRAPFQILIVSDLDRLGREQLETGYVLKQIVSAGVRVFSYLDRKEIAVDSPMAAFMMQAQAFGASLEREKAKQRTFDALERKARAGHVTGGTLSNNGNDTFAVRVLMQIDSGGVGTLGFGGTLSHQVFPPTIVGNIVNIFP
jgi:DNA invertase Pin-like site-specific DNA recombinase